MMLGVRNRRRLGAVIWITGAIFASVWGWSEHKQSQAGRGLGRGVALELAAPEHGVIEAMDVELHDPVQVGQVLARFDVRVIAAERDEYAAEALAVADANAAGGVEALSKDHDRQKELQERVDVTRLQAELRRMEALRRDGAATQAEVDDVRMDLQQARARIAPETPDDTPTNEWWITAALGRVDGAQRRMDAMMITATLEGRVEAIYRRPGEFVNRGDPVLRIAERETREVIAWFHAGVVPAPGDTASVERPDGTRLRGAVISVGDGPTAMPLHALLDPTRQEWGVAVRVVLEEGTVGPDEPVIVRL